MRHRSYTFLVAAAVASTLLLGGPTYAAPEPEVTSLIEGKANGSDQTVLVLIGKRVRRFRTFNLNQPDGTPVGEAELILKTGTMLAIKLPAGTTPGAYQLELGFGRRGLQTHDIEIGTLPTGAVTSDALEDALKEDLSDAVTLGGNVSDFYQDVSNLNSGTLDPDRFSAWGDLSAEGKVGTQSGQLAPGDHVHDNRYYEKSELNGPGTLNAAGNPVAWTKLHGVPADFADGTDADTTYTAGDNVSIDANAISVPSIPWASVTGRPAGLDDGDQDTKYGAGTNVQLTGTTFAVPTFPWAAITGKPAGLNDGDQDTKYTAGPGLQLHGSGEFSIQYSKAAPTLASQPALTSKFLSKTSTALQTVTGKVTVKDAFRVENDSRAFAVNMTAGTGTLARFEYKGATVRTFDHQGNANKVSDRRLKERIETVPGVLERLAGIRAVTYRMKTDPGTEQLGVVAQEVQEVFPELIRTRPDGYLTVCYENLSVLAVQAINEQQAQLEAREREIAELRERLERLEGLVEHRAAEPAVNLTVK